LPIKQQLVIDGYLCSDHHYCGESKICKYEAPLDPYEHPAAENDNKKESSESETAAQTVQTVDSDEDVVSHESGELEKAHHQEEEEQEGEERVVTPREQPECPICKFLKGGPCKDEFLAWDHCLKALTDKQDLHTCFEQTKQMMTCMQKFEYYDIMIAGTDFSKMEAAEQMRQQEEKNQEDQQVEGEKVKDQ